MYIICTSEFQLAYILNSSSHVKSLAGLRTHAFFGARRAFCCMQCTWLPRRRRSNFCGAESLLVVATEANLKSVHALQVHAYTTTKIQRTEGGRSREVRKQCF